MSVTNPIETGTLKTACIQLVGSVPQEQLQEKRMRAAIQSGEFGEKLANFWSQFVSRVIKIDRLAELVYPDWVDAPLYPELIDTGLSELDLDKVELWLHNSQKSGSIGGVALQDFLQAKCMLERCLGLREGLAIAANWSLVPESWKGQAIFLWRSVVRHVDGRRDVPFVYDGGVDWTWLGSEWGGRDPAARLGK